MYYENEYREQIDEIYANIPGEYDFWFDKKANDDLDLMFKELQEKIKDILENIANLDEEYLLGIFRSCKEIQECRDYIAFSY